MLAAAVLSCAAFGFAPTPLLHSVAPPPLRTAVVVAAEPVGLPPGGMLKARLALVGTTALWGLYPTSIKLLYAADGALLSPTTIIVARFAIMAAAAQFVLAQPADDAAEAEGTAEAPKPRRSSGDCCDEPLFSNAVAAPDDISSGGSGGSGFWRRAWELGLWGCVGTSLTSIGLSELPAIRVTLLLATVNLLTPAFAAVLGTTEAQRRITPRTWLACALCLFSTVLAVVGGDAVAFVTNAGGAAASLATTAGAASMSASMGGGGGLFSPADALMLAASCAYAICKVRLGSFVQSSCGGKSACAQKLAAGRLQTQAVFAGVGALATTLGLGGGGGGGGALAAGAAAAGGVGGVGGFGGIHLESVLGGVLGWAAQLTPVQGALLLASALVPGVGATLLQAEGQRVVPAASYAATTSVGAPRTPLGSSSSDPNAHTPCSTSQPLTRPMTLSVPSNRAQPIFALLPIFAAGWAAAVLHEPITLYEALGGLGTVAAATLAASASTAAPASLPASSASSAPVSDGAAAPTTRVQRLRGLVVPFGKRRRGSAEATAGAAETNSSTK